MKNKIFTVLAAGLALAACESGNNADSQNVSVGRAATPGTPEDFKANIRDRVFFAFDKSAVSADAKKTLEAQSAWLKTHSATTATVEGHADERGTREYNLALGARRAEAAKSALAGMGVDGTRMKTISYGKDKSQAVGTTEEAHAQNRVAITVIN